MYFNYSYDKENLLYFLSKDVEIKNVHLKREYFEPLPISRGKYNDMQELCNSKIIPNCYRLFYDALPVAIEEKSIKRKLLADADDPETVQVIVTPPGVSRRENKKKVSPRNTNSNMKKRVLMIQNHWFR